MIQPAIIALITSHVPEVSGRITPIVRGDGEPLPAITFQSGSGKKDRTLDAKPSGIERHIIDLDVWGATYSDVKDIEKKILLLDGFMGTVDGVEIGYLRAELTGDDLDAEPEIQTTSITLNITTTG